MVPCSEEAANFKGEFQRIDSIGARARQAIVGCEKDRDEKWPNYSRKREETRSGRRPTTERIGEGLPTRFPSNATGVMLKTRHSCTAALFAIVDTVPQRILQSASQAAGSHEVPAASSPIPTRLFPRTWHASEFTTRSVDHYCVATISCITYFVRHSFFVLPSRLTEQLYLSPLEIVSTEHVSNINHSSENVVYLYVYFTF